MNKSLPVCEVIGYKNPYAFPKTSNLLYWFELFLEFNRREIESWE